MTKIYVVHACYTDKQGNYTHYISDVFTNHKKAVSYSLFMEEVINKRDAESGIHKHFYIEEFSINNLDYSELPF